MGSRTAAARDTVLARVVDFGGRSLFAGCHGRPLAPRDAANVVDLVHAKLGSRGRKVPIARLQDPDAGRFIIDCWEDAVAERDERASRPPVLQNTDGDPLLSVTDSFPFDGALRSEIESRLAAMTQVASFPADERSSSSQL